MEKIRWGILSTGGIARTVSTDLVTLDDAEIVAVGSRRQETADDFGDQFNVPRRYDSYEKLVQDDDIDVIYIATPHSHHYENLLLCLNAGKHVLCEKAFTLNARQAEEAIQLARQKNLFLMEAMWTRFIPATRQVRDWLAEGAIGEVKLFQADFYHQFEYNPEHRLFNPALGGGALLDLGIYPIAMASMVLGLPDAVSSEAAIGPTGVDENDAIVFRYNNGAVALLACGLHNPSLRAGIITGTEGTIQLHPPFFHSKSVTLHRNGETPQTVELPYDGNGYQFELQEVNACLRASKTESDLMPLDETLALMRLMDNLRQAWGVRYPNE